MTEHLSTGLIHATAVAINGSGLLITGPSGSGKSGLALQLISLGANLISDDQVILDGTGSDITLSPPDSLKGKIEARYFGILDTPYLATASLRLVVALGYTESDRLPHPHSILAGSTQIDLINGANVPNLASALIVRFGES